MRVYCVGAGASLYYKRKEQKRVCVGERKCEKSGKSGYLVLRLLCDWVRVCGVVFTFVVSKNGVLWRDRC